MLQTTKQKTTAQQSEKDIHNTITMYLSVMRKEKIMDEKIKITKIMITMMVIILILLRMDTIKNNK